MIRNALTWLLPVMLAVIWWPQQDRAGRDVTSELPWSMSLVGQARMEPALLKRLIAGNPGAPHRFIVELVQQADLSSLSEGTVREEYREQVVTLLQATAAQSQAAVLAFLEARQADRQVGEIRPFWILNAIAVTADADTALALAARPDVRLIREDQWRRWLEPFSATENETMPLAGGIEWNIATIQADEAWSAFGLDGNGVTVAIMDTGVDWQHPALQAQYRGYHPGGLTVHEGNWLCTTDEGYLYPVDGHGHGTHVAGTAVGGQDNTGTAIGVAPGAKWIAVKTLDDAGFGYESWIHAAFEWLLAPEGNPALAPDVVNGSWGGSNAADETFRPDLQALRAAGIVPVFAAGNEGPTPSSLHSPGSYPEAIAVGASDDLDQVAAFSSRGPSPWNEIKPEIVAPGAYIRSSLPGGTYGTRNGTSMATPHVTGLVALLLQANPALTVSEIQDLLTTTAFRLGSEIPNNDSGWGRIDAYQAAAVATQAGHIAGQINRQPDGEPLSLAQVAASDHEGNQLVSEETNETGHYRLALPPGQYTLEIEAFGYVPQTIPDVTVQTAITTTVNRTLTALPGGVLWGGISDAQTGGPVGADLHIVDTPAQTTSDPQTGQYSLALPAGTYTLQVSRNGYRRHTTEDIEILADQALHLDIALTPAPTLLLVDSGAWYYGSEAGYFEQALVDGDYVYDLWKIQDLSIDQPSLEDLAPYEITLWSSPLDSPALIGAGDTISSYLSIGGNLFLTGQDIGYWDDGLSGMLWHGYYQKLLKAKVVADNAGRADILGLPDRILHDLTLPINGLDSAQNQSTPDQIRLADAPQGAAVVASYANDGDAAIQASGCQSYRAVYLAAGLEGVGERTTRAETLDRVLTWLDSPHPAIAAELDPPRQDQVWLGGTAITYTVELRNVGQITDQFTLELASSGWTASVWDGTFGQPITQSMALGVCHTQTVGIQVIVPADVKWNVTETVTLTARSQADPGQVAQATFHSKAPAPILLVNDYRWYNTVGEYQAALEANALPYDVWSIAPDPHPDMGSPPLSRLQRHAIVLWFTSYDWHLTLTEGDENRLAAYLDSGGRFLLSSQDYLYTSEFTDFARDYLGVAGYTESLTVTRVVGAGDSPVVQGPDPIDLYYPFRNYSDALRFSAAARPAFWGQHGQPVALTQEQAPWKTAFFAFPLEAMPEADLALLIGQAIGWLSPLGDSSLSVNRATAAGGDPLAYTLQIRNTGLRPLDSVSLSNTVPISASYVDGSLEGPATYDPTTRRFTWAGPLPAGEMVTIRYRLQLDQALPPGSTIRNVAHLEEESGLALERSAVSRIETPDLSGSTKVVDKEKATPGEILTYTITLTNAGLQMAPAEVLDPWPPYTLPLAGSAWASNGQITATADALVWRGAIPPGETVTLGFAVVPASTCTGLYAYNRANLNDGWGYGHPLETNTWIEARFFLPLLLRQY